MKHDETPRTQDKGPNTRETVVLSDHQERVDTGRVVHLGRVLSVFSHDPSHLKEGLEVEDAWTQRTPVLSRLDSAPPDPR